MGCAKVPCANCGTPTQKCQLDKGLCRTCVANQNTQNATNINKGQS